MGARICMNKFCGATVSSTWKKGWKLKSGQIADLCLNCGSVYEKLSYCDTFHSEEPGWRECSLCNKRVHCGCSASLPFIEIQDFGGVWCINCAHSADSHENQRDALPSEVPKQNSYDTCELQNLQKSSYKLDVDPHNDGRLFNLGIPSNRMFFGVQMEINNTPTEFARKGFENLPQPLIETPKLLKPCDDRSKIAVKDVQEPNALPPLNINLGTPVSKSCNLAHSAAIEEGEMNRLPFNQPMPKAPHNLPKPAKINVPKGPKISELNKGSASQKRMGRPHTADRLRNQLLPRYWPRITDQELQKLSGDLNSTIVPLFEKVLSASDASRIGRLVLPKACAEAYFPIIHQSEGLPLKIQDVKGNEWKLQFRYWPNNNSRMYVLEGVTPCIQSMQLQAGDTVTFSRIDPGGKLVIGSRKTSIENQGQQTSALHNALVSEDNINSDASDGPATVKGFSGLLQSLKGNKENTPSAPPNCVMSLVKNENSRGKARSEAKACTVGSKRKRSIMENEDAMELRITWEEMQYLFRPPQNIQPNVVVIETFEFEEYDEPPVFGKRTLFTTGFLAGQDQWAQCDKCEKWRRLPCDVLLPPKWSCLDNVWDLSRSSCSAPEEVNAEELGQSLIVTKVSKKQKGTSQGIKPCGLDALANAAPHESLEPPSNEEATTTKHPRHRPGCTCIVCSQPPSGKGNHEPNCLCNVCSTVRRRFKTLMMRKKQKQRQVREKPQKRNKLPLLPSEDNPKTEARNPSLVEESEERIETKESEPEDNPKIEERKQSLGLVEKSEGNCKEIIDLNSIPVREDDVQVEINSGTSVLNYHTSENERAMQEKCRTFMYEWKEDDAE